MSDHLGTGTATAQLDGTALPPPRVIGDMTTLTLADGATVASFMALETAPPAHPGQRPTLHAGIVCVAAHALTLTF